MMTVRDGPMTSAVAGPSCRTHIMLNTICSSPPCSQPALRTVHQRPNLKTGIAPLAPNRNNAGTLGDRIENRPFIWKIAFPDASSVKRYRTLDPPMTIGTKPKSEPSCRTSGPKPQSPGLARPQLEHLSSRTPTSDPHDGQPTEPVVRPWNTD